MMLNWYRRRKAAFERRVNDIAGPMLAPYERLVNIPPPSWEEVQCTIRGMHLKARRIATAGWDGYARATKLAEIDTAFETALRKAASDYGVETLRPNFGG